MSNYSDLVSYLKRAMEFPQEIHLESSSRCNCHCLMCPRDKMQRELGELDKELFIKAVEETADYEMDFIMLHLNGEPLLLDIDELIWRINYARECNPKTKQILFFTNGALLDRDKAWAILHSKLDLIMFSIHGGNKEDYEKVMRGLKWETTVENIRYLITVRNKLGSKLIIQTAIIPQEANKGSVKEYFEMFHLLGVDHVAGSGVNNIGGLIDADNMKLTTQRDDKEAIDLPCWKIFLDLSVMSDGRACVCAQDVVGALPVGDLKTETLKEIWQGKVMSGIREKFIYGKKNEIPFCDKCDYMKGFTYPDFWNVSKEGWIEAYEQSKN